MSCCVPPFFKLLIFKSFAFRPISSSLVPKEGHPCGVPPRLRRGSPSGKKWPLRGLLIDCAAFGLAQGGAARALTRLPLGVQPASEARRPKAGGFPLLKKLKLGGARPKAAQLEPVGMWAKAGEPVGNPCGQARGQAQPVHQLVQQGCPRAERSEPAGGRLRPSSTYPRAGKGAKRPRRAKPGEQARRALQPAQPVTTLRSKV